VTVSSNPTHGWGRVRRVCGQEVFATEKRIQFCAVVDSNGRLEAGGMRPGMKPLEPEAETERIVTRTFLDQATDPYLGRARWAIVRRERLVQVTFPLSGDRQLQLAASADYTVSKVAKLSQYLDDLGPVR
jgi:hypothetical protein